jgi:hypothetical protein
MIKTEPRHTPPQICELDLVADLDTLKALYIRAVLKSQGRQSAAALASSPEIRANAVLAAKYAEAAKTAAADIEAAAKAAAKYYAERYFVWHFLRPCTQISDVFPFYPLFGYPKFFLVKFENLPKYIGELAKIELGEINLSRAEAEAKAKEYLSTADTGIHAVRRRCLI